MLALHDPITLVVALDRNVRGLKKLIYIMIFLKIQRNLSLEIKFRSAVHLSFLVMRICIGWYSYYFIAYIITMEGDRLWI